MQLLFSQEPVVTAIMRYKNEHNQGGAGGLMGGNAYVSNMYNFSRNVFATAVICDYIEKMKHIFDVTLIPWAFSFDVFVQIFLL